MQHLAANPMFRFHIAASSYNWQDGSQGISEAGRWAATSRLANPARKGNMVERRIELNRRYHRKKKLKKLKSKFRTAKEGREKDGILRKIRILSPWWKAP